MAQAALQEELIPAGGIADFVMSDAEIAALESEEAEQQFGTGGIARFEPIAKRMASYGRYGDDQVAHVETGELLVPRALIEGNPKLKESIFNHLREMGVEDPERYVVGSSANSINPETGMPEFFLKKVFRGVRKTVSKVAKGVSKAISSVGKVLKKVAPVVLPIALAMTPLGAMYGAALGSGIGTLIQGGNIKDALKSAITAGAIGGITAGFTGPGSFTSNIKAAAANPMGRLAQTGSGISEAFRTGSVSKAFGSYAAPIEGADIAPEIRGSETEMDRLLGRTDATTVEGVQAQAQQVVPAGETGASVGSSQTPLVDPATGDYFQDFATPTSAPMDSASRVLEFDSTGNLVDLGATTAPPPPPPPAETSFLDTVKGYASDAGDYMFRGGQTVDDVNKLKDAAYADVLARTGDKTLAQQAFNAAGPGVLAKYGPSVALAGVGAAGAGFFDTPPEEPNELAEEFQQTGVDLLNIDPNEYMVAGRDPRYATGPNVVGTQYGYQIPNYMLFNQNPFMRPQAPQMRAADGGEVYPRRNGGIMPNEGIPDQDSVRALLMPGEFVMTKDAVRGLGGGNLNQGINNMYGMMRNLEMRGRRMA